MLFKLMDKPMDIFTYLNKKRTKSTIFFLNQEIEQMNHLLDLNSNKNYHQNIMNYSQSVFYVSDDEHNDSVILN